MPYANTNKYEHQKPLLHHRPASGAVMLLIALWQIIREAIQEPALWLVPIFFLVAVMLLLSISILRYARKLHPKMTWLPPPSTF